MTRMLPLFVLALLLSSAAFAQTKYKQSTPAFCQPFSSTCDAQQFNNGVGGYIFNAAERTTTVTLLNQFAANGTISFSVPLPPLVVGESGNFAYTYALDDGHTGAVSGSVTVVKICTFYWYRAHKCLQYGPDYEVLSSTLTVNQ